MQTSAREQATLSLQPLAGEHGDAHTEEHGARAGGKPVNPLFAQMEKPWANDKPFLVDFICLCVLAAIVGLASVGYEYVVQTLLEKWLTASGGLTEPDKYPNYYMEPGHELGSWTWIPICWAGGTFVGLLKFAVGLDEFDSFLVEIRAQHCEPVASFKTTICCMASLLSGACLGPEAGLASAGGGLGTLFARATERLGGVFANPDEVDARRRLYAVGGICAAFGTIMPAPWVGLLICVECSLLKADADGLQLKIWGRRTMFLLGIVATLAFTTTYSLKPVQVAPDFSALGRAAGEHYENSMPFKAILIGAIAAFAALIFFIIQAIFKKIFVKLAACVETRCGKSVRIIAMCSLTGLLTGLLGYLVPLSLASGKESMFPTIIYASGLPHPGGDAKEFATSALVWTALAKAASFSAASAGGMVGGPFFPILYYGVVVGELIARIPIDWSVYPAALAVPCAMVAVPSAAFPVPFTFVAIPLCFFHLGPLWCVPILASILTAYTLVVGSGLVKKLAGGG